jgi:hypothetical protein
LRIPLAYAASVAASRRASSRLPIVLTTTSCTPETGERDEERECCTDHDPDRCSEVRHPSPESTLVADRAVGDGRATERRRALSGAAHRIHPHCTAAHAASRTIVHVTRIARMIDPVRFTGRDP